MKEQITNIVNKHCQNLIKDFVLIDNTRTLLDSRFLSIINSEQKDLVAEFIELTLKKNDINITVSKPYQNKSWAIEYLSSQSFIMQHLTNIICDLYGGSCSVDQARFLYESFFNEHFLEKYVSFDKTDYKYSYHIPETCSKENWINLVFSLLLLKTGKSDKLIVALKKIKSEHNKIISTYQYVYDKTVNHLHYILNDWFRSKDVFINPIDSRFPNQEYFNSERYHNYKVLTDVYNMLINKTCIWKIIDKLKEFKRCNKFPRYKKSMTLGEKWELQEKQEKGEIYLYHLDNFYYYIAIYKYSKELEKRLKKISMLEGK